ncbi:MAG: cell wall hydrolase [Lachnospiraceae bacterium]
MKKQSALIMLSSICLLVLLTIWNIKVSSIRPGSGIVSYCEYEFHNLYQDFKEYETLLEQEIDVSVDEKVSPVIASGYTVSAKEFEILSRIIEAEATGLDIKAKVLVGNVVLNRVMSSEFPDTIEAVVFQNHHGRYQFSPVYDGRYHKVTITEQSKKAAMMALKGIDYSNGALYFISRQYASKEGIAWFDQNLSYLFEYQGHEFFR